MCLDTVQPKAVRLRNAADGLLEEARTALGYHYPDLALAYIRKVEALLQALDRSTFYAPDAQFPPALRALRDARRLLMEAYPDLPVVEHVTGDTVLERLLAEAIGNEMNARNDRQGIRAVFTRRTAE
jgi:hypothetical protein